MSSRVRAAPKSRTAQCWAIWQYGQNILDGETSYLVGQPNGTTHTLLFATRRKAQEYISETWGYMAMRPDLRAEPHGWRMPKPIRVEASIRAIARAGIAP